MNRLVGIAMLLASLPAVAQQVNWQELALQAQKNSTVQQMIDNSMIAALQAQVNELRAQLAKQDPPAEEKKDAPKP